MPWTTPTMLSFCASPLGGFAESIRISGGFCNFWHECPSCRMTFIKRSEQILRSQYLEKNFMNRCCFDGAILKPSRNVMRNVRKHKPSSLSLCGAQTGNGSSEESAPQEQDRTLPSFRNEPWTSPTMPSFCAQPQGGVAESII